MTSRHLPSSIAALGEHVLNVFYQCDFFIAFEKSKTLSNKTNNCVGQNEEQTQNYLQTCAVAVPKYSPM